MPLQLLSSLLLISVQVPFLLGCTPSNPAAVSPSSAASVLPASSPETSVTPPTMPTSRPSLQPLHATAQGIQGKVRRLLGDQMPTIRDSSTPATPSPSSSTVQTKIWIFSGRITGHSPRWPVHQAQTHSHLLGQVESNGQGEFSVGLPPGEYTLFAQYESDLYLNSFLGDGTYATVQVLPNQIVEVDLVNSEGATF